jgi:uncharacterized membrane protein
MNISHKIGNVLQAGGIIMAVCFVAAIILRTIGSAKADMIAEIGIYVTAATPVAGVVAAMILLFNNKETKHAFYAAILLMLILMAGLWRLAN